MFVIDVGFGIVPCLKGQCQAPTHLSGALVRPDPGIGSCVCVYKLANQSQDGKCQI